MFFFIKRPGVAGRRPSYTISIKSSGSTSIFGNKSWPPSKNVSAELKLRVRQKNDSLLEKVFYVSQYGGPPDFIAGVERDANGYIPILLSDIVSAEDARTGQAIPELKSYFDDLDTLHEMRIWDGVLASHKSSIRALVYIAKTDGKMMAKERALIGEFMRALSGRPNATLAQMNAAMERLPSTSLTVFQRLCGEIAKMPLPQQSAIVGCAVAIATLKKDPNSPEAKVVDYLEKRILVAKTK